MDAITVEGVRKRFRLPTVPKQGTLKEALVTFRLFDRDVRRPRFIDAVNDVSFTVQHGATLGIIGRNGSGKSTLMRLLAGIYVPDSGSIRITGAVAPLLSLGVGFHPNLTGRENVKIYGLVLGLTPRQIREKFEEIVAFSELGDFIDVPVRTYSSGMYVRLAFSVAVSVDPDVLLLDEVLAVGDQSFALKCRAKMAEFKEHGKTIVLVTHDTSTVLSWCSEALWLDKGRLRASGSAADVIDAYNAALQPDGAAV